MRLREDGTPDPVTAYDVPPGESAHECPVCGAPFPSRDDRALHHALVHGADGAAGGSGDAADDAATLDAAREREERALRRFRLKALGVVVALYFVLLMVYALV